MSLEQLLTTIESDQFEIDADNQLHAKDVKTLASIRSSLGITYFDQFTARLTDSSRSDCETALQKIRAGALDQTFITLRPLNQALGHKKHLLLARGPHNRVQAALVQARDIPKPSALIPTTALSEVLQTLSTEAACLT
ncbi:hypothetical protein N8291_03860, partial [Pseudomonadales bacterium]|nr:hypothetical protein [Pseudomonadales bacterium]